MMDYGKFIQKEMGVALQALPPKERADMNRLVQNVGKIMGKSVSSKKDLSEDLHELHTKFKENLAKTVDEHNKMQNKHADTSNR